MKRAKTNWRSTDPRINEARGAVSVWYWQVSPEAHKAAIAPWFEASELLKRPRINPLK